jgi:hypothetical protein
MALVLGLQVLVLFISTSSEPNWHLRTRLLERVVSQELGLRVRLHPSTRLPQCVHTDSQVLSNGPQAEALRPESIDLCYVHFHGPAAQRPPGTLSTLKTRLGALRDRNAFLLGQRGHDRNDHVAHDPTGIEERLHEAALG